MKRKFSKMTKNKKKWIAKWDEEDITVASAPTRTELACKLQRFMHDNLRKPKGKTITIKIFEAEW
jgi:hypothetical protein